MATAGPAHPVALNFPGPIGPKRRRMRSGGNVSTLTNNAPNKLLPEMHDDDEDDEEEDDSSGVGKTAQTSKCKGATTIPIFLKKTYKMIDTCDPNLASWTPDGEMFVVKDPEAFATQVIPLYFDHNKFSSFARQLNFYGFRKMQSKPIRNSDYDAGTAKHVTFFNENFKRGRCDLLKNIQRSTRGGGTGTTQDHGRDVQQLRDQVAHLEQRIAEMNADVEDRMRRLELDMLARMEQMMLAMQQQQQAQLQLQSATSVGTNGSNSHSSGSATQQTGNQPQPWDVASFSFPRGNSINSAVTMNSVGFQQPIPVNKPGNAPPTLPPHPKQKQLPVTGLLPPTIGGGPPRLNSLRGISTMSRGLSTLSRGGSVESSASAVLMKNSWEDKFFSMLMLGENEQTPSVIDGMSNIMMSPTPLAPSMSIGTAPATVSNQSSRANAHGVNGDDDLSDVSDSGLQ